MFSSAIIVTDDKYGKPSTLPKIKSARKINPTALEESMIWTKVRIPPIKDRGCVFFKEIFQLLAIFKIKSIMITTGVRIQRD